MAAPRAQPLFFGTLVNITDFRCRHPDSGCSAEEYAAADQLVFIRGGVFVRHDGNRRVLAEPTNALLFNRQQPYRVSHPHSGGDDCTVLAFAPGVCDAPFRATHARVPPATLLRVQSLRRRLRAGVASDLEAEETALEQLGGSHERIRRGSYGRCVVCNAEIEAERLEALPWTPYCLTHASMDAAPATSRASREKR